MNPIEESQVKVNESYRKKSHLKLNESYRKI